MSIEQLRKVNTEDELASEAARILNENQEVNLIILGVSDFVRQDIRRQIRNTLGRKVYNGTGNNLFQDLFKTDAEPEGDEVLTIDTHTPGVIPFLNHPMSFVERYLKLKTDYPKIQIVFTSPSSNPVVAENIDIRVNTPLKEFTAQSWKDNSGRVTFPSFPASKEVRFHVLKTEDPRDYSLDDLNPFTRPNG